MKSSSFAKLTVRLSRTEAELVKHAKDKSGLTQNEFLRQAVLDAAYLSGAVRKNERERVDFLIRTIASLWAAYIIEAEENNTHAKVIEAKRRAMDGLKKAGYIVPLPAKKEEGND